MATTSTVPGAHPTLPAALPLHHSWVGPHQVEGRAGRRLVISPRDEQPLAEVSLLDAELPLLDLDPRLPSAVARLRLAICGTRVH